MILSTHLKRLEPCQTGKAAIERPNLIRKCHGGKLYLKKHENHLCSNFITKSEASLGLFYSVFKFCFQLTKPFLILNIISPNSQ